MRVEPHPRCGGPLAWAALVAALAGCVSRGAPLTDDSGVAPPDGGAGGDPPAWDLVASGAREDLRGLWGSGSGDVWAVGDGGAITRHGLPDTWTTVPSGTSAALYSIWGSAADDIWTVGTAGTVLHWNGSDWASVSSGTDRDLYAVWGSGAHDVWIVGAGGTMLHRGP